MKNRVVTMAVASALAVCCAFAAKTAVAAETLKPGNAVGLAPVLQTDVANVPGFIDAFGEQLAVIGRVDAVSDGQQLFVVGQRVTGADMSALAVGDYVAVVGGTSPDGGVLAETVVILGKQYVPGASLVFVRGSAPSGLSSFGSADIARQKVDFTPVMGSIDLTGADWTAEIGIVGVQPVIEGVILARDVAFAEWRGASGSLGTGKVSTRGSLGTGKVSTNGSLGTGKVSTNGSLGTGKVSTNGSLGTGKVSTRWLAGHWQGEHQWLTGYWQGEHQWLAGHRQGEHQWLTGYRQGEHQRLTGYWQGEHQGLTGYWQGEHQWLAGHRQGEHQWLTGYWQGEHQRLAGYWQGEHQRLTGYWQGEHQMARSVLAR